MKEFKNANNGTSEKNNINGTIISDIIVTIFSSKKENSSLNQEMIKRRAEIIEDLGIHSEPSGGDNFWLFYENYNFSKKEHDKIKAIVDKYSSEHYFNELVHIDMNCLYDYTESGTITLGTRVRISDPCYDMDTWCAGSLENVLPGTYNCFVQKTGEGRVAGIKIVHEEYDPEEYEPDELQNIDVGVDSGECGIYDEEYFAKNCKDQDWYESTYVLRDGMPLDDKAFISSSGYGDGSYECFVARNSEDKIVAIKIVFIDFEDDEEDY